MVETVFVSVPSMEVSEIIHAPSSLTFPRLEIRPREQMVYRDGKIVSLRRKLKNPDMIRTLTKRG